MTEFSRRKARECLARGARDQTPPALKSVSLVAFSDPQTEAHPSKPVGSRIKDRRVTSLASVVKKRKHYCPDPNSTIFCLRSLLAIPGWCCLLYFIPVVLIAWSSSHWVLLKQGEPVGETSGIKSGSAWKRKYSNNRSPLHSEVLTFKIN